MLTGEYLDADGKKFPLFGSIDAKNVRVVVSLPTGATLVFTVPNNARWKFNAASFTYNTDATPGNRVLSVQAASPVRIFYIGNGNFSQPPSTGHNYGISRYDNAAAALPTIHNISVPIDLLIPGNQFLHIAQSGAGGNDQFLGVGFQVEEWLDNV